MKRINFVWTTVLVGIVFLLSSCKEKASDEPVRNVKILLNESETFLEELCTLRLTAKVTGIENYSLYWKISDESVAVIESSQGDDAIVLGKTKGSVMITVGFSESMSLPDNIRNKTASCIVNVTEKSSKVVSELPFMDYNAATMDEKVAAYEKKLGRELSEIQLPFEDADVPPFCAYFKKELNISAVIYDITSLVYDARMLYAFSKEDYDKAEKLYSMLEDRDYTYYGKFDGIIFYSKPGETVKISPVVFNVAPYEELCTMVEFIKKDVSMLQPKKIHAVIPSVADLPALEVLEKDEDDIKAYEEQLGLRYFKEIPEVKEPNMMFVSSDPQKTNLEYVIYYKNFEGEKFIEARFLCLECMEDVKSKEFIEWMNNCGYPVENWDTIKINGEDILFTTYGGSSGDKYVISIIHKTRDQSSPKTYFRIQIRENK